MIKEKLVFILLKLSTLLSEITYESIFKKKTLPVDLKKTKILFNRTDRIGDAIVTLPFLLALKKENYNFEVLCSTYNEWVLKPFVKTIIEKDSEFTDFNFKEFIKNIIYSIFLIVKKFSNYNYKKNIKNTVFFDLKGDYKLSDKYKFLYQIHCKSFLINLTYSDYVINDFYVFNSKNHLIEKYSKVFDNLSNKIEEFPEEIKNYIIKNHHRDLDDLIKKIHNYIIVFVGNKEFRNLDLNQWKYLIENINFQGYILVIDDPNKKYIKKLKKLIKKQKVIFIEKTYDLWSLMYLAMFSKLVIGVDGGGFNFLQMPTNAFEIILYTNENTWRPFSRNEYVVVKKKNNWIIEKTITSLGHVKYIIYLKDKYKVVYEILQKKGKFINNINLDLIIKEVNNFLNTYS